MLCQHCVVAQNLQGDMISNAEVFMVPYVDDNTVCDSANAVLLYDTHLGGNSSSSLFTDATGRASFWMESGLYLQCVSKSGLTDSEVVQVACGSGDTTTTLNQIKTSHTIQGDTSFTLPINGTFVRAEITENGEARFPRCQVVNGQLELEYADDCQPTTAHEVCIYTYIGSSSLDLDVVCGYTGAGICEAPVLGTVNSTATQVVIPFSTATGLAGQIIFSQSAPGGTMNVAAPTVNGMNIETTIDLSNNAEVGYNILIDKMSLDRIGECTAPTAGILNINGLVGGVGGSQIQKAVGGAVNTTNMDAVQGNVYETINNAATTFNDVVSPSHFAGDPDADVGSTFTGSIQVFDNSAQTVSFSVETCYYTPVRAEYDSNGNFVSAEDANGNAVAESAFVAI